MVRVKITAPKKYYKGVISTKMPEAIKKDKKELYEYIIFQIFVFSALLSNSASKYCEHCIATPLEIRVKRS